jgi:putative toxin-antitoxin system antitoxin component (TIGR02293 family)
MRTSVKNKIKEPAVNYNRFSKDKLLLTLAAKNGIRANNVLQVLKFYKFSKEFIANMLDLSTKTLDRYTKENRKLNPNDSELIIKLLILYKKGIEIFGEQAYFIRWMNESSPGVGNLQPVDIINTSGGIDLIMEELSRIEFGDLS